MGYLCCLTDMVFRPELYIIIPVILLSVYFSKTQSRKRSINGRHVLITGGSSGIGLATAFNAAKEGAKITIVARNIGKLQQAQSQIEKVIAKENTTGKVQYFSADLSGNPDKVTEMLHEAEATFGPVFMLVNCAGYSKAAKFEELSHNDVKSMMDVNFTGSFFITQEVVKSIKRRGEDNGGVIVFTSSQGGLFGLYGYTAYAASKGALVKMAEALHMEVLPYNISVTVAVPPDTDTPGFIEENKTKPNETALISAAAGLFKAEEVADKMMSDALTGKFYSTVGIEGFMLTTLCAGMGPITHCLDFIAQVFLSGLFRSISAFYLWSFGKIVKQEYQKRLDSKKRE